MRVSLAVMPLLVAAGCAAGRTDVPMGAADGQAKVPALGYQSAFEDFRRYGEQELADWRKANEEVGAAGGHAGHRPGQGPGRQTSKPQPGTPEPSGGQRQ